MTARGRASSALAAAAVLLSPGCTSSGPPPAPGPTPLATTPPAGARFCGFLPRATVVTALGRTDLTPTGGVTRTSSGLRRADCHITVPGGGNSNALDVDVKPVPATAAGIVRTARSGAADLTLPAELGIGFADRDSYQDAAGRPHRTVEGGLIRGDWEITYGIQLPARGRDPLDDSVPLLQQVIATLHLPARPTRPYPAAVASAIAQH